MRRKIKRYKLDRLIVFAVVGAVIFIYAYLDVQARAHEIDGTWHNMVDSYKVVLS